MHTSWVWPIVCNSFHKLEHDFCTKENTKEHDLEHDFCTEGSTKTARFRARFLHGGGHQRARSRARFLHGGEHERARSREEFFAQRGTPKTHGPDHDFLHEAEQFSRSQKARARARFLHGGKHQRARSRARFLHERKWEKCMIFLCSFWRGFHRKTIFRLLQRLGYTQDINLKKARKLARA